MFAKSSEQLYASIEKSKKQLDFIFIWFVVIFFGTSAFNEAVPVGPTQEAVQGFTPAEAKVRALSPARPAPPHNSFYQTEQIASAAGSAEFQIYSHTKNKKVKKKQNDAAQSSDVLNV